ncbi:hypothetical protein H490_0112310 [Leucobacter sp. UCD-THU]|uniref:hypothetical protein n=1 Tax=Leucobacter sp. UCD-THU TaxID=1292023 RepID=UPI00037DEB22|nr:hypothetical protein [Leucobacter sp. UCD-THU]EYT52754.1 hypothetical protein H490_0112310 [Leucobacter sp. UCD-THU]
MTASAPPLLPRFDRWPPAVRSAERLRGSLVGCGPGVRGAGWPDTPRVRASALGPWLTPDRVAVRLTAAWVWGACRDPGRPLEFSTLGGRRPPLRRRGPDLALHQFVYPDEALHVFDPGLRVTGPAQTVCDLLRTPGAFEPRRRVAVRLLLPLVAGGADEIRARLVNGRAQYRCVALGRLDAV